MARPRPTAPSAATPGRFPGRETGARRLTSRKAIALSLSSIIVDGMTPAAIPQDKHSGTA